ncbi:Ada metal-binding domain-containing protein [Nonomuraea sp. NEAU-A123]|uniref:Ada metal-binding domain-containing protein n=1 Tax=Nonomuraea sp. NEAU-A123 TaxID=2839649 RepID=UPI0020324965|nr:Ada metal-binding domain-containing protein [Nonomuraea sp. NEAU-A123]
MHTLIGADGWPYTSAVPGTLGGHRRARLYGRLDCPSALRAISRGGYVEERVFFADEVTAIAAGYRPCAVCLPQAYQLWKTEQAAGNAASEQAVAGHTAAELAGLLGLLAAARPRVETVVIGHGRDAGPSAEAFADAWEGGVWEAAQEGGMRQSGLVEGAVRDGGVWDGDTWQGTVLAVVDWPEEAASWLRQARRFAAGPPDAWVVAGAPLGWARMSERLRQSTDWDPGRTFGFASTAQAVALAAPGTLEGMRGADTDGTTWQITRNLIHRDPT